MSAGHDWSIPKKARPDAEQVGFDLDAKLDAVLQLRAEIPSDAFTAQILGTERHGNAVVIDERGLIVTIGYLVSEAETIWLTTNRNTAVPAHLLGYDFATGFALLQTLGRLDLPALELGSIQDIEVGDPLVVAGGGGHAAALQAHAAGRREFAGYWEYVLDEALFTVPAHPHWGGTAVIDYHGKLVGIGSLLIQAELADNRTATGNMVVPVDLLPSIADDLQRHGAVMRTPRPWLGLYASDGKEGIIVTGTAPGGPSENAGIEEGDRVVEVAGHSVDDLAELWRGVWVQGEPGVDVPLKVEREGRAYDITVRTSDRTRFLRAPKLH